MEFHRLIKSKKMMRKVVTLVLIIISNVSISQCLSGDCENGYGKYNCDCGYVFEGNFVNGEKVNGTLTKSDLVYTGEFKNDIANGKGLIKYKDGSWFEGTFSDNLPDGYGVYHFSNGQTYTGQLNHGVFEGFGVQVVLQNDGSLLETQIGNFYNDALHGMGVIISDNGNIYCGEFEEGKLWGFGVYTYANDLYPEAGEFRKSRLQENVILLDYPNKGYFGVNGCEVDSLLFHAKGDIKGNEIEIEGINSKGEKLKVNFNNKLKEFYFSKFENDSLGTVINLKGEIYQAIYQSNTVPKIQAIKE